MNVNNISLNKFYIQSIIAALPFFLISGSFLPDLIVTLLSLYFVVYCIWNQNFFFFKNSLISFFLIFYIYININSFFSNNTIPSFLTSLPYLRMILFAVFFSYLLQNIFNLKKIVFFSFLISYVLLFIDSLIQIKTGQNILGYSIVNSRVSSLFRDKLVMGSYVSRTLPILLAISYLENFKQVNFLRFFVICLACTLVFFSAERISTFYIIITIILYLILLPNKKQIFLYIGFFLILLTLLISFKPSTVERVIKHTLSQQNENKGSFFSERHDMHYLTAYRMFLNNKFFGHGIKSFRYLCDQKPFSVKDVITNNHRNYSTIDGYFYINTFLSNNHAFYVPDTKKIKFETKFKILENVYKLKNDHLIIAAEQDLLLFLKNNSIKFEKINYKIISSIKSSSKVNMGDYVFSNSTFENGCNTHPHNIHLQFLSELGLFGYFFLASFFIYLIILFVKNFMNLFLKKKNKTEKNYILYKIFIIQALILHLFPLVPSGNFFNNWLSVFFYFNLAFLFNFLYFDRRC